MVTYSQQQYENILSTCTINHGSDGINDNASNNCGRSSRSGSGSNSDEGPCEKLVMTMMPMLPMLLLM